MATNQFKQVKKSGNHQEELEAEVKAVAPEFDIEDVLNDIDDVLEENAEEFVAGYIQKGGE